MMGTKVNVDHEIEVELESHELAAVRRLRYLDDIMTDVLDSARAAGHRLASETVAGSGRLRAPRGTPLIEKRGLRCCRAGASPAYDIRCDPRCSRTRAEGTPSFAIYAFGILGEGERKSAEPIAARACADPESADQMHNQMLTFLSRSNWEDEPVRRLATGYALGAMQRREEIRAWIVDDTGFLKQGKHSVGVQRQYTGSAGKTTNCQIGVSLTVCTATEQLPIDMQLYLPESWTGDPVRRKRTRIPDEVVFRPKWRIALDMIEAAVQAGFPVGVLLGDAAYGNVAEFR